MFARTALLTILALSFTTALVAFGEPVDKPSGEKGSMATWLPISAFKENPDDDELTRLLKERYRSAAEEEMTLRAMLESGIDSDLILKRLGDAESRASRAALELCQTSTQRIAVLEKILEARKGIEAYRKSRHEAGTDPAHVLPLARYERLDAEIALVRAKREAAKEEK
jgi:hypothetical protein